MKLTDAQLLRRAAGLTTEEVHRKSDLLWRRRVRHARRVKAAERASLGLQAGVGVDDHDLQRARFYRAIEHVIAREVREAELSPLAAIGFDGRPPQVEGDMLPAGRQEREPQAVFRNVNATPLDYLFFQSRAGLEHWAWLAGKRFEYDWHMAQGTSGLVVSLEALLQTRIQKLSRAERRALRIRPPTFKPKPAKRQRMGPAAVADCKLDAMARLGRLCDSMSPVGFYLLQEVVGAERWLKDVALRLGVSADYAATRFREALVEAAAHYRLSPSGRPRKGK